MDDDGIEDGHSFNLCKFAASEDRWDSWLLVAVNSGCWCSEEIQLELLNQ